MAGLTSQQKGQLLEFMASSFKKYAMMYGDRRSVGAVSDPPKENLILIYSCGADFGAILDDRTDFDEVAPLKECLFQLIERGCPVLDIIDLMFACTKGRTPAIPDRLESIGLSGNSLHLLRFTCQLVSEKISALNGSGAGPLYFLPQLVPELSKEDRVRLSHDIQRLPELIGLFGDLLSIYPPSEVISKGINAALYNGELVFFYVLLDCFKFGFPALGCLLRAMRHCRDLASPSTEYLSKIAPIRVTLSEQSQSQGRSDVRDPLGNTALQKRLNMFSRNNESWYHLMHSWIVRYLSDEFSERRKSGAILFSVLSELGLSR